MRYLIMSLVAFWIFNEDILSQDNKFTIRSGTGYYMDTFTADDGPIIWCEGGYKLSTGFYINGRLSASSMDWLISSGIFKDYKTVSLRQMLDVTFSKPIKLTGRHFLEPGIGLKLKREYLLKPDFMEVSNSSGTVIYTSYSDIFYEIGFTICLDYYYQFPSNFYMGLRADSNVIWALGFEGLTFSPLFGFRF